MKEKVAVYFRCSTDKQDKSIADQRTVLIQYAADHDMTITTWFDKDEGRSGTSFEKRPDFMRMVGMIESGRHDFKRILVYDVDRWGRPIDPDESTYWEYHLKRYGVKVTFISDAAINENSFSGRIQKMLKQENATEESRKQSLRVRERSKMRAKEGFRVGGFAPYGFKRLLVEADGTTVRVLENGDRKYEKSQRVVLVPGDPDKVDVVRQIFKARDRGKSIISICRDLNDRGVAPPSSGLPGFSWFESILWNQAAVQNVLTNPVYKGDLRYNRLATGSWVKHENPSLSKREPDQLVVCSQSHEGIVDDALFDRVQQHNRVRKTNRSKQFRAESPYLLTGLIKCAKCWKAYYGHKRTNCQGAKYGYYESSCLRLTSTPTCARNMIPKGDIETFVLSQCIDRVLSRIDYDKLKQRIETKLTGPAHGIENEVKRLDAAIGENSRRIENLMKSIELGLSVDDIIPRINDLKVQREKLNDNRQAMFQQMKDSKNLDEKVDSILSQVSNLREILSSSSSALIKQGLSAIVQGIEVDSKAQKATCSFYKLPRINGLNISRVGYINAGGRT